MRPLLLAALFLPACSSGGEAVNLQWFTEEAPCEDYAGQWVARWTPPFSEPPLAFMATVGTDGAFAPSDLLTSVVTLGSTNEFSCEVYYLDQAVQVDFVTMTWATR